MTGYCMSKAALKMYSDGLRRDMNHFNFGIKVITIEPSMYKTNMSDERRQREVIKRFWKGTSNEVKNAYGHNCDQVIEACLHKGTGIANPNCEEVVDNLIEAIVSDDPNIYYRPCGKEWFIIWLFEHFADLVIDWIYSDKVWSFLLKTMRKS